MAQLSATTTRASTLSKVSTRGSSVTRTTTRDSTRGKKSGLFSKIKHAFGKSSAGSHGTAGDSTSAVSGDSDGEQGSSLLAVPESRRRRRSSVFSSSKKDRESVKDAKSDLEERKARCMAIKVAKRDPLPIQRLLVDCEFCNPPPHFGRDIDIKTPAYTAESVRSEAPSPEVAANELAWNTGLAAWTRIREWWLKPTAYAVPVHHMDEDLTPDKYYTVYDKMVYQTRPLKHPLNLDDMLKIVKSGWVGEGTWPEQDDPNDVWSTSDAEDIEENIAAKHQQQDQPPQDQPPQKQKPPQAPAQAPQEKLHDRGRVEDGAIPRYLTSRNNSYQSGPGTDGYTPSTDATSSFNTATPSLMVTSPPGGHVQFSELPHPKSSELHPATSRDHDGLPPLERMQSGLGAALKPMRSNASSVISITDSE